MRHLLVVAPLCLLVASPALAEATRPGPYFVTPSTLNVRLAPNANAKVTNRLYRQNRVEVLELRNGSNLEVLQRSRRRPFGQRGPLGRCRPPFNSAPC